MPEILKRLKQAHNLQVILPTALCCIVFFALQANRDAPRGKPVDEAQLGFTLPAEIQVLLYAGDRYLASNIEYINAAANGVARNKEVLAFRAKAHKVIADLNPCYEDNMYFSNAFLSWGGLPKEGNRILEQSTACRTWDDIPPFFLGFNRYFFFNDIQGGQQALKQAIERSDKNKVALQRLSISIESNKFDDRELALAYLEQERDQTDNTELKDALQLRIGRLKGLITLDKAQVRFEQQFQRPLVNPQELIDQGIISAFPQDPLRIGYEFRDNAFHFQEIQIQY